MNSKHLATGDACPPLVPDKLRIYSMRFCPYAQRALLVAAAKKIPYDVVNVNLVNKPEFIFEKNPGGKVPTIEIPGVKGSLYESLIVCDYMDDAYPISGPGAGDSASDKLNSTDPFQKAADRILIENFSRIPILEYRVFFHLEESGDDTLTGLLKDLYESLIMLEKELNCRETKFFAGNSKPGMIDYMIWPWFERIPSDELLWKDKKFDFAGAKKPLAKLNAWQEVMKKDSAVLESYLTPEIHLQHRLTKKEGAVNYDILL